MFSNYDLQFSTWIIFGEKILVCVKDKGFSNSFTLKNIWL